MATTGKDAAEAQVLRRADEDTRREHFLDHMLSTFGSAVVAAGGSALSESEEDQLLALFNQSYDILGAHFVAGAAPAVTEEKRAKFFDFLLPNR